MTAVVNWYHYRYTTKMPKDDETVLSIRFPNHLAAELKVLAKEEHRSVNGTVLEAVERYLRSRRGRQPKDVPDGR